MSKRGPNKLAADKDKARRDAVIRAERYDQHRAMVLAKRKPAKGKP